MRETFTRLIKFKYYSRSGAVGILSDYALIVGPYTFEEACEKILGNVMWNMPFDSKDYTLWEI